MMTSSSPSHARPSGPAALSLPRRRSGRRSTLGRSRARGPSGARRWARRLALASSAGAGLLLAGAEPALAAATGSEPAGGAATFEVLAATVGAGVVTAAMLAVMVGHRRGLLAFPGRMAAFAERTTGMPGWASLPSALVAVSLLLAVFGMYWDISLHIDEGRDAGPLANPAHYFILVGLFGITFAGLLSMALPLQRPSKTAIQIAPGWFAPLGGVLIFACGAFALSGFPLDDMWHRLFGQDVTLWGPTHLLLIGGASLSTLAAWLLFVEGLDARSARGGSTRRHPPLVRLRQATLASAFLVALSTFQAEFDFGVPQFRLLFHPVLLMLAAGMALVAARVRLGRGGALLAVAGFLVIRGFLTVMVGPVLGQTEPHFPLYAVEALLVELVALRVGTQRPLALGALSGVAIGTIGLTAEWGWSHVWATIPWPGSLFPEAAIAGLIAAVAGGVIGGAVGGALVRGGPVRRPEPSWLVPAAAVSVVALIAFALPISSGDPVKANVSLQNVRDGDERAVSATFKLDPPEAAENAEWLNVTAWQGGGSVVAPLRKVGPGVYRTTEPIPVHGGWKAILRLHKGGAVQGMPIFLPRDEAIPAREVPAPQRFTRAFVRDKKNLQREQKEGVSVALTTLAYLSLLAIALGLVAVLAWGLVRLERGSRSRTEGGPPRPRRPRISVPESLRPRAGHL
jgi:hypothetical protein